jgi:hypothetical protein
MQVRAVLGIGSALAVSRAPLGPAFRGALAGATTRPRNAECVGAGGCRVSRSGAKRSSANDLFQDRSHELHPLPGPQFPAAALTGL